MRDIFALLSTPRYALTGQERQLRAIIDMMSVHEPCPHVNCYAQFSVFEGMGTPLPEWDFSKATPRRGRCPSCRRPVNYVVPMARASGTGWTWRAPANFPAARRSE